MKAGFIASFGEWNNQIAARQLRRYDGNRTGKYLDLNKQVWSPQSVPLSSQIPPFHQKPLARISAKPEYNFLPLPGIPTL